MKGMQQAGLVQGPVLNCPDGASKTRMGNQEHPGKSCAHIQSAERCTCSRRIGPAWLCAPGCSLAQGCCCSPRVRTEHSWEGSSRQAAFRNICLALHTERQGAQRDTSQGAVFARTLFLHIIQTCGTCVWRRTSAEVTAQMATVWGHTGMAQSSGPD